MCIRDSTNIDYRKIALPILLSEMVFWQNQVRTKKKKHLYIFFSNHKGVKLYNDEILVRKNMLTVSTILFLIFLISSFVQGEAEKFHVTVGVAFSRHVNSLAIDDNSENIEYDYQLVTEDKKQLYTNTWLKYKWTSNEIYGLPLEGNEGVSIYYIKITTQDSADKRYQEIKIFTSPAFQSYFHQVKVCTHPKTVTHLMNRLDTRYALMEMLAKNLMDTAVENLRLKGCLLYTSPSPRDATLVRMPSSA